MKPVRFRPTTEEDLAEIQEWIDSDIYHKGDKADWWLFSPQSILAVAVDDSLGSTMYLKVDGDGDKLRLHVQFPPLERVSKLRIAKAITDGFPRFVEVLKQQNVEGIIFASESPILIKFMEKQGFQPFADSQYFLRFREAVDV